MHDIIPQSIKRKCILRGIEKPLHDNSFQVDQAFTKSYSFYCNLCDKESKLLKFHPNSKAAPDLVNSDKSLDLKA